MNTQEIIECWEAGVEPYVPIKKPLALGCTKARHERLGIHAVINARGGQAHLNDYSWDIEEIEMRRDAQKIKDWLSKRIRFYQFCSRYFRKREGRMSPMRSSYED